MTKLGKLLFTLTVALTIAPAQSENTKTTPNLLAIAKAPLLVRGLYPMGHRLVGPATPTGAVGVNANFKTGEKTGEKSKWFIEQQRTGGDIAQAGLILNYPSLVDYGWTILDWGFDKQAADGGFPGTGDAFHGTSLFVEAAARCILLEKQTADAKYKASISSHTEKVHKAALWLLGQDVKKTGKKNNAPYTHRLWALAAALGETAEVTGDKRLAAEAEEYAREGLALQKPDGVNPEKGGFDSIYQCAGVVFAERYATVCHDAKLRDQIIKMLTSALRWEQTKVEPSGTVLIEKSTGSPNEKVRSGNPTIADYQIVFQAFALGYQLTKDNSFEKSAETIALGRRWLPSINYAK